ncbi:MAG: signal peptidase I [Treponema sp.]|nr:signal peptidase I [Treponema sp.]
MFSKRRHYSYTAQKHQRHKLLKFLLGFIILFVIYNCLSAFFFSVWVIDNTTMQPGLNPGDRLLFTSFTLPFRSAGDNSDESSLPYKRGSIVLIDTGGDRKLPLLVLDSVIRFFTAQKISLFTKDEHLYIKRVIGLPGDEVSMADYIFRVKPGRSYYSLTEFEFAEKPYYPAIPQQPALYDDSIPFSSNMAAIVLGNNECFVVSDDRSNTNDSRTWGPVSSNDIAGTALFRFWPVTKMGRP